MGTLEGPYKGRIQVQGLEPVCGNPNCQGVDAEVEIVKDPNDDKCLLNMTGPGHFYEI